MKNFDKELNVLISKNVAFLEKQKKQLEKLFENNTAFGFFVENFIRDKEIFLNNIQFALDTNKSFECLKYINKPHAFYCYRYKKSIVRQNTKNIRCIFFIYEGKIVLLEIFSEKDSKAYDKAKKNAISTYNIIVEEGD